MGKGFKVTYKGLKMSLRFKRNGINFLKQWITKNARRILLTIIENLIKVGIKAKKDVWKKAWGFELRSFKSNL